MTTQARQRGVALIMALILVAIVAAVAGTSLEQNDFAMRRLEADRDFVQARWVLKGGTEWARTVLAEDARSSSLDHGKELWASGLPPTQIEQGTIAGKIVDEQGLFNLTNLLRDGKPSERDIAQFRRLLASLGLRTELADAIAAQPPVSEIGDLYRVPGCNETVIATLKPFITVLPRRTALNVNTAPPKVLAAVIEGLSLEEAQVLVASRLAAPLRDKDDLRARMAQPDLLNSQDIAVGSSYFLVRGRAQVGKADVGMEALLERSGRGLPSIVWERVL
jgi:general secretion pathway protein K